MALDRGWANFLHGLAGFGKGYTGEMDKQFERKRESDLLGAKMAATAAEGEAGRKIDREKIASEVQSGFADRRSQESIHAANRKSAEGIAGDKSYQGLLKTLIGPYGTATPEIIDLSIDLGNRMGIPGVPKKANGGGSWETPGAKVDGAEKPGYLEQGIHNIGTSMGLLGDFAKKAGGAVSRSLGDSMGAAGPGGEGAARGGAALMRGGGVQSKESQLRGLIRKWKSEGYTADQIEKALASQGF